MADLTPSHIEIVEESGIHLLIVGGTMLREATQIEIELYSALSDVQAEEVPDGRDSDGGRLDTERRCFVCGGLQKQTPSGWTCENGHGGAKGVDKKARVWKGNETFGGMPSDRERIREMIDAYPDWFEVEPDEVSDSLLDSFGDMPGF